MRRRYKARIVADAEGEAQRFTQLLASYLRAPGVTRQRLYFETLEEVFGNTNKVLVDTKGTGNMIYLPLDKLTEGRTRTLTLDEQRQVPATVQPRAADRGRAGRRSRRKRAANGGHADAEPWLPAADPGRRRAAAVLDGGVHRARNRARAQVPLRRDRARRLQARPAFPDAGRQQRGQVRQADPHRGLPGRAVPDQRRQDPAHQLLREVAHQRRLALSTRRPPAAARKSPTAASAKSSRTASRPSSRGAPSSRSWPRTAASSSAKCSRSPAPTSTTSASRWSTCA